MTESDPPVPLFPAPDRFFANLPRDAVLTGPQQDAVRDLRALLSRLALSHVRPADTTATLRDGLLALHIPHRLGRGARMALHYGDRASLHWPGGMEQDGAWNPRLADTAEALLTGRNTQTICMRLGHPVATDTELWPATGRQRILPTARALQSRGAARCG